MMKKINVSKGSFIGSGPVRDGQDVEVSACAQNNLPLSMEIFDKNRKRVSTVHFPKDNHVGSVYSVRLHDLAEGEYYYRLKAGKRDFTDPYAKMISGNRRFGKRDGLGSFDAPARHDIKKGPHIDWDKSVLYLMNVRGFTKDRSSGVSHPGTFSGIKEKIPYLKSLGVTALLIQPAYDFNEVTELSSYDSAKRVNLWGYTTGNYFVPKGSYCAKESSEEFSELVNALHENRMELIMQFYFLPDEACGYIQDILRYWVMTYKVDGFQVMGAKLPVEEIAADPYLLDTKLIFTGVDPESIFGDKTTHIKNLGSMNDAFMYDMRKYLKGDEDMLQRISGHVLCNPDRNAVINYITTYSGFTLADLVSYERKHNEKNGEGGSDGSDYNYSWNCGEEGKSRKKSVQSLRFKQMKNAMTLLILSQGVPMLRAGDEFCNSQEGNNNPWCQDNKISYLDWKDLEKNKNFHTFVKKLLKLRAVHPVFRGRYAKKLYDYISCGVPDASFHGEQAWHPSFANYNRHFGILYSGSYERIKEGVCDDDFFVAYNMHWTGHRFHPPKPGKGKKWEIVLSTGCLKEAGEYDTEENELFVSPRSIVVLRSKKDAKKGE